ncbi:MAG: hypothetical protein PHP31_02620 [Lentimicrobiaceae bacterium]|nr:hypothetical protein [Lentimicrobiaceae bacterium]
MKNGFKIRIVLTSFLLILLSRNISAQSTESYNTFRISPLGLSYAYEMKMKQKSTLIYELGASIGYLKNNEVNFHVTPYVNIEPRYYYNIDKRNLKNKKTMLNSANYISTSFIATYSQMSKDDKSLNIGILPKWGLRRPISNVFFYGADVGGLFYYDFYDKDNKFRVSPYLNVKIGVTF